MTVEFKLPDLGEGIHEAEIIAVKVKEGEMVKEDQIIFEVETDKAVVEIPSPHAGAVAKIHVAQGQTVKVGCVMIGYDIAGKGQNAPSTNAAAAAQPTAAVPEKQAVTAGNNGAATIAANQAATRVLTGPIPATPATRRLARELGIDLHQVNPSGPAGRVLKDDVMAYAAGSLESRINTTDAKASTSSSAPASKPASAATSMKDKYGGSSADATPLTALGGMNAGPVEYPDFAKYGDVERLPLKSIRRKIAMNMTQAWTHIPHVTHFDEANVTELSSLVTKYEKEFAARSGDNKVRPTLTVFTIKALASALKLYPQFNSSLDENTGEIVIKRYYNIGVAVATDRGLIVPVIKNVDQKSFYDIAAELADIAAKTRAGKIELDRLQGGTFTLTNIGAIGGTSMSPMVNFLKQPY